jgi:outer membrane biosynthesis protein TonB
MMEQKKERRKLGLAILISLFLHVVVGFSLAAFGSVFAPTLPVEDKPAELSFVDLSAQPPPSAPKDPPFMETAPDKESAEKPKEQTFESNANSIAATNLPSSGNLPLPTQDGVDRPVPNLDTHQFSLPSEGSTPQPEPQATVAPQPKPTPVATPAPSAKPSEAPTVKPTAPPVPTPEPEQFAMLTSTPPPPIKAPDEVEASPTPVVSASAPPPAPRPKPKPEAPASSYQAEKQQNRISGNLTTRGPSSVNAVGTPLGRYQKAVSDAIGSRWYHYMNSKMDLISIGTAHIEAEVDAQGHLQNLRVVSNNANEAFANICLQSFQEAHIPPIPPDLIATLPDGRMHVDFSFTAYANQ